MTNAAYDVLDNLYFMISGKVLQDKTALSRQELILILNDFLEKDWVLAYEHPDGLALDLRVVLPEKLDTLYFLATKKGLFAHQQL